MNIVIKFQDLRYVSLKIQVKVLNFKLGKRKSKEEANKRRTRKKMKRKRVTKKRKKRSSV